MKCPMCHHNNDANATECAKCAVILNDTKRRGGPESVPGIRHDSNPNNPVCQSCGSSSASIFPGVLRGGGVGYCSECYGRMRRSGYTGKTDEGSSFANDIRDLLAATAERVRQTRDKR